MSVATISATAPFLSTVAQRLWQSVENKADLGEITVWVPSPRQGQAFAQALLSVAGHTILLPRILPLQLPEDIPETLSSTPVEEKIASKNVRQLVLARLIRQRDPYTAYTQAWSQAAQLASLLDELDAHDITPAALQDVVPAGLARHWQKNLEFLEIILSAWPAWLAENDMVDAAAANRARLQRLATYYKTSHHKHPVWAVGFADTTPAGQAVLKAIAAMPQGRVVLPAVACEEGEIVPPSHPQYNVTRLAQALAQPVEEWTVTPQTTEPTLLETGTPQAEAATLALMMRAAWEEKRSCALITPDRTLAARTQAELSRWGLQADDSAGQPLASQPWGRLLALVAQTVAERCAPVPLAELLRQPLLHATINATDALTFTNTLLRGLAPPPGLAGLRQRWHQIGQEKKVAAPTLAICDVVLNHLAETLQPLTQLREAPLADFLDGFLTAAEKLTAEPAPEDLQALFTTWHTETQAAGPVTADIAAEALQALLANVTVRQPAVTDRLFIWGPLEARLQEVETVLLAGLNEGTWPRTLPQESWLNESMRTQLGLPTRQRFIGLSAHDFYMLTHLPQVVLSRSQWQDGVETTVSRFVQRWQTGVGPQVEAMARERAKPWLAWAQALQDIGRAEPATAVVGQVEVANRPTFWSASSVNNLMSCPYRFFAEKVLNLPETEGFAVAPEARERGQLIHTWLQAFHDQLPALPEPFARPVTAENASAATAKLTELAHAVCAELPPTVQTVWLPRLLRLVPDLVKEFQTLTEQGETVLKTEQKAQASLNGITLHAKADRLDGSPHGLWLVDYKTGEPPKGKEVVFGRKPQLAVEAWLQHQGAYQAETALAGLSVWHVPAGSVQPVKVERYDDTTLSKDLPDWQHEVAAGLHALTTYYQQPAGVYVAVPGKDTCRYCPYAGVCRKVEWAPEAGA